MGVMPFLAACHACVLMLYCIAAIVCYICSFEWQIKFSLFPVYHYWATGNDCLHGLINVTLAEIRNCIKKVQLLLQHIVSGSVLTLVYCYKTSAVLRRTYGLTKPLMVLGLNG